MFAQAPQARAQDTVTGAFEGVVSDSQSGAALKGAFVEEGQIVNATKEESFAVPTIDQRGVFASGATASSRARLPRGMSLKF